MNLSVVMVGRNDNYGGDFIGRMERSLGSIRFPVGEVVVIEWMPPVAFPPLAKAVRWPEHLHGRVRMITVPGESAMREYVAKNVGIRRAYGDWVLATNPDILFPADLLGPREVDEDSFVRAIRVDRNEDGSDGTRHNNLGHTGLLTEACGDFLMMTKDAWLELGGYLEAENPAHCDSHMVFRADAAGMRQVIAPFDIVHQWHPPNPVGKGPFDPALLAERNDESWGLAGHELPETQL